MSKLEEMQAKIEALEAANKLLKDKADASAKARYRCQVSEKKAVSFYGLGRFPVTLYDEQWTALANQMPTILAFCEEARKAGKLQNEAEKAAAKEAAKKAAAAKKAEAPTV
jgi:hypothetical protein